MITIYLKQYNKIIRNADTALFDELGYDDILWHIIVCYIHAEFFSFVSLATDKQHCWHTDPH